MARKSRATTESQPTEQEQDNTAMASSIITDDTGDDDFVMQYDSSLDGAVAPEALPEGRYRAQIVDMRKGISQKTGKDQVYLRLVVDPEDFPADYSPENAPDGLTVNFYSQDVDDSRVGRYNMRKLCESVRAPLTQRVRKSDFINKHVLVDLIKLSGDEGQPDRNFVRGVPRRVD